MINYFVYLSVLACVLIALVYWRSLKYGLSVQQNLDFGMTILISGFVGARLFHVFYEEPLFYRQHPSYIFYFWYGGFVFYGGAIAGLIAGYIFCKKQKISYIEKLNFFTPIFALGYSLGRIACFIAGCCYGKYCDLLICRLSPETRHPTQLYAMALEFLIFIFLSSWKPNTFVRKNIFYFYLTLHPLGRLVVEHYRDDFRGAQVLGTSISSVISWMIFSFGLAMLFTRSSTNLKK